MLSEFEIEAIWLSAKVSLWAVVLTLPLALAVAWLLARRRFPGKWLVDGIVHLPLVVPPVVVGYILLSLLGRASAFGAWLADAFGLALVFSWRGAALAAGVMAFPLMVRAMRLSLEAVDRRLEVAARTLGAGPARVFATITLPLIFPGVLTATVLGFARALGEFGATITFAGNVPGETRTLPLAIYSALQSVEGQEASFRLTIIAIVIAVVALAASEAIARRMRAES